MSTPLPEEPQQQQPSHRPSVTSAIQPLAVVAGAAADLIATILGGLVLINVYAMARLAGGTLTREQMEIDGGQAFLEMYITDPSVLVVSLIMGLFMTALGGFVAARMAKGALPLIHGLLAGLASLLAGLVFFDGGGADLPNWVLVFGYALHLPAAVVGGLWYRRKSGN